MNKPPLDKTQQKKRLKDKVIMIIHGLSESGRVLAVMLAEQGSDVAVVDFVHNPPRAERICHDVEATGQRCVVLTWDATAVDKKPVLQLAMDYIIQSLGGLDTFISYSPSKSTALEDPPTPAPDENGRVSPKELFDEEGLAITALRQIHMQKLENE